MMCMVVVVGGRVVVSSVITGTGAENRNITLDLVEKKTCGSNCVKYGTIFLQKKKKTDLEYNVFTMDGS